MRVVWVGVVVAGVGNGDGAGAVKVVSAVV